MMSNVRVCSEQEAPHVTTQERISKTQIVEAMQSLPDDAGIEQAVERLYVLYKIQRGLDQLDAGQGISHEEAMRRMARWLE
jgi:predicted transcriptional regulator